MTWKIELSEAADRQIDKLDPQIGRRILKFLHECVAQLDDPRNIGEACKALSSVSSGSIAWGITASSATLRTSRSLSWCSGSATANKSMTAKQWIERGVPHVSPLRHGPAAAATLDPADTLKKAHLPQSALFSNRKGPWTKSPAADLWWTSFGLNPQFI